MEKTSHSIYVAFPVKDGKGKMNAAEPAIVIWTTTPWTLPANLGISVHPEFDYVVVAQGERHYVVAQGLLEQVRSELGWTAEGSPVVSTIKGAELDGMICRHPFYERDSLVMVGEHVTLEAGTGCVHTAPGHGEDDFVIGKKYGLEVLCPVDDQGKFTASAPDYEGMYYEKANAPIIERLQELGLLLKVSQFQHQYPHDWRTKKPVIFRATEQWFASIDAFRAEMLEEINNVKWTQQWGRVRLHNMIADRGDWCISRQRTWGVPIPIMYCRHCGEALVNEQTIAHIAGLFDTEGSAAWYVRPESELLPAGTTCGACGHGEFRKETDIMDVWFDSGASHVCVLETRPELQWPADLYLEGSDQYRGWYNSSLITGVAVRGRSPYKGVLSHGFVLDGEGRKMSKSLGNTVDPVKTCNTLGADILRLWVASVDYQADVRISDNILAQITEVYRKIRNTLRYLLGNFGGFDPMKDRVALSEMGELDRYALIRLQRMTEKVVNAYETYEFHVVYQAIHHFCAVELSAFYLDILKDRLYADGPQSLSRRAAQTVLYDVLLALTKLIAPILPHTADEVWRCIPGVEHISVQLSDLPQVDVSLYDEPLENKWARLIEVRDEVLKALEEARKEKMIGNSLAAQVQLYPNEETAQFLAGFAELDKLFIVSDVIVHAASERERLHVEISPAPGEKCERCWNVTTDVGTHEHHPTLCGRCVKVVELELV